MTADNRCFAVLDGDRRIDLVASGSMVLGEVLDSAGIRRQRGQLRAVDGSITAPGTLVADLADGALLTVVDPSASVVSGSVVSGSVVSGRREPAGAARRVVGPWWALAATGLVTVSVAAVQGPVSWRFVGAAVLGVVAVVGVVAAVRHRPTRAVRVAAPAVVGVAAGAVAVPRAGVGSLHLAVVAAALVVATLVALAAASDRSAQSRAAFGVVAVVCGGVASLSGLVLALGWDARTGAAVVVGAVPLGLRALPGALFAVPDGWLVDVERYQDTRWAVRDRAPAVLDSVDGAQVRAKVRGAADARVAGTVLLSGAGAAALLLAVPAGSASAVVRGGQIGLLVCYAAAMALLARSAGRHLHWVPRASAVVAVVVGVRLWGPVGSALTGAALGALVAGLVAVAVAVVIGRGGRSLVWSRVGDVVEAVALALCLPAGLLAGDVVEVVRTLVA
ncbi:MAG: hypothetical protein LBU50_02720 [Cellulomonas sp.]|jgi:hypothetical protein|nr:hypothetical protein [Cellulomonas sp.]